MKRLLSILTVIAALFAVALPTQAAPYHRTHLGSTASTAERDSFGCGSGRQVEIVRTFLLYHNGRYSIAKVGTVKHQSAIVDVCAFLHQRPVAVRVAVPPPPNPCDPIACPTPATEPTS
jgi:hypothetical protein